MSNVGYRRFDPSEDELLQYWDDAGIPISEQAEQLVRPVGSVKSRRRILGLSKTRATPAVETPTVDDGVLELVTMRKYVVYFYAACLFTTGLLAFFGDL